MALKPGDIVHHVTFDQDWVVGAVYEHHIIPLGWPCSRERIDQCEVVESCSAAESQHVIESMARMSNRHDPRRIWAERRLAERVGGLTTDRMTEGQ